MSHLQLPTSPILADSSRAYGNYLCYHVIKDQVRNMRGLILLSPSSGYESSFITERFAIRLARSESYFEAANIRSLPAECLPVQARGLSTSHYYLLTRKTEGITLSEPCALPTQVWTRLHPGTINPLLFRNAGCITQVANDKAIGTMLG